jgi:hypothetical protein
MNRKQLGGYVFSIPERFIRSLTGIGGGAALEVSEVLLPIKVRRSRLYRATVGTTLQFLVNQVGQIQNTATKDQQSLPSDYLLRRAAGNVVELAGIVSFHASPVWVLAALADLAGAGRDLIEEITSALQAEGLLPAGRTFQTVDQLLDGLERTAGRLSDTINTPPLDVATLRSEWDELRRDSTQLTRAAIPVHQIYGQWRDLQSEAAAQGQSVLQLSSVIALSAVRELPENMRTLTRIAHIGGKRVGEWLTTGLFGHYRKSLGEIREVGYLRYWLREFRPYLDGVLQQFSSEHVSTTERLLNRKMRNPRAE